MIEAIRRIGEYVVKGDLTKDAYLNGICRNVPEIQRNQTNREKQFEQHVVFLNFNTQTKKIEVDFEKVNAGGKNSGREYLWIGNNPGAKGQIFLTTDCPIYLFTKALPNLKGKIHGDFKTNIEQILNEFFDEGIVDPSKFDLLNEKAESLRSKLNVIKKDVASLNNKKDLNEKIKELKIICKELGIKCTISSKGDGKKVKDILEVKCEELMISNIEEKLVNNYKKDILERMRPQGVKRESLLTNDLLQCRGIKQKEVSLYTVKLNGDLLVKNQEYRDAIYDEKLNNLFDEKNKTYKKNLAIHGKCSICKKENLLATTSNATNLKFKFYMTDKIGFSSNFDGNFKNNYNICKECYQYLMIAENFITDDNNLSTRIGGLSVYIIPHFIFKLDGLDIAEFSEYIKYSSDSVGNLESLRDFQNKLVAFREYEAEKNNFIINYLFYQKSKSEFKILKLIKDVPPGRLDFIRSKIEEIANLVNDNYEKDNRLKIDLNRIWGCIPIKNGYSGFTRYLDIVDSIFSDKRVDYNFLINQFTEVIRIIKFEREGYNIQIEQEFTKIIQLNFLLLFLSKLKVLGGLGMGGMNNINIDEVGESMVPKMISEYWSDVALYEDEQKRALFLLGYLIGEIGNAQSVSGHKKKPILNKINFQGMGTDKLRHLTNDVLEKLRQYDKLQYNEDIYSVLKLMIDNNIANWKLSNHENVFYSLSGYAFSNYLVRKRSKDKYFQKLKNLSDCILKAKEENKDTTEMETILEEAKKLAENYKYSDGRKILDNIEIPNENRVVE